MIPEYNTVYHYIIEFDNEKHFCKADSLDRAILEADEWFNRTLIPMYTHIIIKDKNGVPLMEKKWLREEPLDSKKWLDFIQKHKRPPENCFSDWIKL